MAIITFGVSIEFVSDRSEIYPNLQIKWNICNSSGGGSREGNVILEKWQFFKFTFS